VICNQPVQWLFSRLACVQYYTALSLRSYSHWDGFAESAGIFPHGRAQRCAQLPGSPQAGQETSLSPSPFQTISLTDARFQFCLYFAKIQVAVTSISHCLKWILVILCCWKAGKCICELAKASICYHLALLYKWSLCGSQSFQMFAGSKISH
jgi:hypothetical protein